MLPATNRTRRGGKASWRPVPARDAFTLVELLMVVAIILMLVALLLPALDSAAARVKLLQCQNNLRQISLAMLAYEQDNDMRLPPILYFIGPPAPDGPYNWSWDVPLRLYLELSTNIWYAGVACGPIKTTICPADNVLRWPMATGWDSAYYQSCRRSYSFNWRLLPYPDCWNGCPFYSSVYGVDARNWGQALRTSEITDGLANTVALVEWFTMENGQYNMSACFRWIVYPEWARSAGYPETYTGLEANHPGSVSLYCDGHVRYCTNTIVAPLWRDFTPNWKD